MSQFICVQVGQCGNQIGSAFWPLALHEYGISTSSGGVNELKIQKDHMKNLDDLSDAFHSFFYIPDNAKTQIFRKLSDLTTAKVKARAVLVDMEDSVVSRIPLKNLFDDGCIVTNYPGSGNNWAVGFHTHGTAYREKLRETLRTTAEKCDNLHGFLVMHSVGGGTGSGLGSAVLHLLADEYPQVDRFESCIYPADTQDVVTAPYNALLSTATLLEHASCVFPADNNALLDISRDQACWKKNINQAKYNALCKPFQDMNSIVANMLLHLTSGARFPGSLNADMGDFVTNLVPYPRLNFIFSSVSPVAMTAPTMPVTANNRLHNELFVNAWSKSHQLVKFYPLHPKSVVIAAAHVGRGSCTMSDMLRNMERLKTRGKFTPWSREAMKIGLCSVPPAGHSASLLSLFNSSAMGSMLDKVVNDFERLYKQKAYAHHYLNVDGFEGKDFQDARASILSVCDLYKEVESQEHIEIPQPRTLF